MKFFIFDDVQRVHIHVFPFNINVYPFIVKSILSMMSNKLFHFITCITFHCRLSITMGGFLSTGGILLPVLQLLQLPLSSGRIVLFFKLIVVQSPFLSPNLHHHFC